MNRYRVWLGVLAGLSLMAPQPATRAGAFNEAAQVLRYVDFNFDAQRNILSGGHDLLVNTLFEGNPLDYGIGDITLQGPLSLDITTGTRGLRTLDISFRTALDGNSGTSPINYLITADVGAQASATSGSLLIDGNLSLNELGYYDLDLTWSSRQSTALQGAISDAEFDRDFDLGPIRARGNIYFDVLGVLTDPLFDALGVDNFFEALSGRATLVSVFEDLANGALADLDDAATSASPANARTLIGDVSGLGANDADTPPGARGVIPEPSTLFLLLPAAALLATRVRSARVH